MNKARLGENCQLLVEHLQNVGYAKNYIRRMKKSIAYVLENAFSGDIQCYADIYQKFAKTESKEWKLHEKRLAIKALEAIDLQGKYPNGSYNSNPLVPQNSYHLLNAEYKAVVDCYVRIEENRIAESTIRGNKTIASSIFLKFQQSGIEHLADATEEKVLAIFIEPDGTIERHYSCVSKFASVLTVCSQMFPCCAAVLSFLPIFKGRRKNIQYITPDEYAKVKAVLMDDDSKLSLRNKAMGLLAIFTGLRGCDIAGLKLTAIDWDNDTIHIKQQKTKVPLTLPLSAIVGNALYDCIEQERPDTDCDYVFISETRQAGRIKNLNKVASNIMKAAGIRQNDGDRKGTHIFRLRLATSLLENGVPRPVISSITGQTSPRSLDTYLSTDFVHLKECAINIDNFYMNDEVFNR